MAQNNPLDPIRRPLQTGMAANMPAPAPAAAPQAPANPYAPISRLPKNAFTSQTFQASPAGVYSGGNPNRETGVGAFRTTPSTIWNVNPELFGEGNTGQFGSFQSKWNKVSDLGNGQFEAFFQDPSKDKYSQIRAVYSVDPATGEYVLQGDPSQFRQQSSNTEFGQALGTTAAYLGGAMFAPALASAAGGGVLGGATAGATVGGVGTLAGGGNSEQALQGAIMGGLAGGAGAAFQGQGWTNPNQPMNLPNFSNDPQTAALGSNQIGGMNAPANNPPDPLADFYSGGGVSTDASAGTAGTGFADAAGQFAAPEATGQLGLYQGQAPLPAGFTPGQTITTTGASMLPGAGASITGGLAGAMGPVLPEQLAPNIPDLQTQMPEQETPQGGGIGGFFQNNPLASLAAGQAASQLLGGSGPEMPAAPGSGGGSGGTGGSAAAPSQQSIIDALLTKLYGNGQTGPDYSQVPGLVSNAGDYNQFSQEAADAAYNQQTRYLDPQVRQQQQALEARLSEQGFVPGTPGYDRAMQNFMDTNARAYAQARDTATLQGFDIGKNFFQSSLSNANLNNQSASQKMAELLAQRSQPFNELASWQNREQVQYGNALDKYNADVASSNSNKQAIGQLIASLGMYFSDARLKEDIVQIGSTPAGVPFYEYTIFGRREKGVLAQELAITQPEAVSQHESGYLIVDYRKVR